MSSGSYCSSSSQASGESELNERIAISEMIPELRKKSEELFSNESLFRFDAEDYENCKLNGLIKKAIQTHKCRLPIIHVRGCQYLLGSRVYTLSVEGSELMVTPKVEYLAQKPVKFEEFLATLEQAHLVMLTYYN